MKKKLFFTLLALIVLVPFAAFAEVNFDASNGTGFVGKGDVQTVLFLNNGGLQAAVNSNSIVFRFIDEGRYKQTCAKDVNGNREVQTLENSFTRNRHVNSSVAYEARRNGGNGQVTGFWLHGFGATSVPGLPSSLCPNDNSGWYPISDIELVGVSGGMLTVTDGIRTGAIWPASVE